MAFKAFIAVGYTIKNLLLVIEDIIPNFNSLAQLLLVAALLKATGL